MFFHFFYVLISMKPFSEREGKRDKEGIRNLEGLVANTVELCAREKKR